MAQRIIHWLHLDVDILNDEKIDVIRSMPEGDSMFVVWIGILCLAMKCCDSGYLYVTHGIPYTPAHLSRILKVNKNTVDKSIQVFEGLGMISTYKGTAIQIINFEKHQGVQALEKLRETSRKSSADYRKKQKLLLNNKSKRESKRESVTVTSPYEPVYEKKFERWYEKYPNKKAREKARHAFLKLKPDDKLFKIILEALEKQKRFKEKFRGQFIPDWPYPATWINQKRWEDEVDVREEAECPFE